MLVDKVGQPPINSLSSLAFDVSKLSPENFPEYTNYSLGYVNPIKLPQLPEYLAQSYVETYD